jgi:hypothetical protein
MLAFLRRLFRRPAVGWALPDDVPCPQRFHCCEHKIPEELAKQIRSLASSSTCPGVTVTVTTDTLDGARIRDMLADHDGVQHGSR